MCNYDDDSFTYKDNTDEILDSLKEFVEDLPLILIDNTYTLNYLENFSNNK